MAHGACRYRAPICSNQVRTVEYAVIIDILIRTDPILLNDPTGTIQHIDRAFDLIAIVWYNDQTVFIPSLIPKTFAVEYLARIQILNNKGSSLIASQLIPFIIEDQNRAVPHDDRNIRIGRFIGRIVLAWLALLGLILIEQLAYRILQPLREDSTICHIARYKRALSKGILSD